MDVDGKVDEKQKKKYITISSTISEEDKRRFKIMAYVEQTNQKTIIRELLLKKLDEYFEKHPDIESVLNRH